MAKGFTLLLQPLALFVTISGARALGGGTRAGVIILIIVVLDDLIV
jgi:hypothetical protein